MAVGLGVVSAGNTACDVHLVADRVVANAGSDFYIEQSDASGNAQETFRITEAGSVGIGTSSVGASLHVESGTATNILRFGDSGRWGFQRQNSDSRYVSLSRNMNTGSINAVFTVDGDNGNVGIGVASPDSILHIKTAVNNTARLILESTAANSYPYLTFKNDAREYGIYGAHGTLNGGDDAFTIYDNTAGAHRLTIIGNGNVGIGVINPGHQLDVEAGANQFALARVGSSASDNSEVTIGYFDANASNGIPGLIGASDFGGLIQGGEHGNLVLGIRDNDCLLYTSPSPRDS